MDTATELKSLIKRDPKVIPVKFKGKKGFLPEYFDFADRNSASVLFSETKEGALENLLQLIKEKKASGGTDGTEPTSK